MNNKTKVTIVLPTYNEAQNIKKFIEAVVAQEEILNNEGFLLSILVVDDKSPDGTGSIVKEISQEKHNVFLLENNTRGLGKAYVKGFTHAINSFEPDILMEMDSDFSHSPDDIIRLLRPTKEGYDFVIGSRYVPGGSIPKEWALIRRLNSYYGNFVSRHVAGVSHVKDCTSGFRAITSDIIKKIDLNNIGANGYYFQLKLLFLAVYEGAKVNEVPINFIDRELGVSKLGLDDVFEFVINVLKLRMQLIFNFLFKR